LYSLVILYRSPGVLLVVARHRQYPYTEIT
jgi:hypothetical protein